MQSKHRVTGTLGGHRHGFSHLNLVGRWDPAWGNAQGFAVRPTACHLHLLAVRCSSELFWPESHSHQDKDLGYGMVARIRNCAFKGSKHEPWTCRRQPINVTYFSCILISLRKLKDFKKTENKHFSGVVRDVHGFQLKRKWENDV